MSTVLYLILVEVRSTVQFVFLDLWPLFAGISFMLINVRAALGWAASQSSNRDEHMSTWRFSPPTPHQETPSHVVGPLVVNISRAEDRSHEFEMDAIPRRADDKYLYDGEAERTSSCWKHGHAAKFLCVMLYVLPDAHLILLLCILSWKVASHLRHILLNLPLYSRFPDFACHLWYYLLFYKESRVTPHVWALWRTM